jgi:DNA-binding NarL/FixJ family response regulator
MALLLDEAPQAIRDCGATALIADETIFASRTIEKLRSGQYVAIVIDTDLPRHSGYGVVTYLQEENGDALQNVVLITSADHASVRQRTSANLRVINRTEEVDDIAAALGHTPQNRIS